MNEILQKICDFADEAHGEQLRKYTPERYIVHPVRVMKLCSEYTEKQSVLAAALLHDVLEDTETTKQEILSFLNKVMDMSAAQRTLKLVEELTDVYEKKNYPQWNRSKRKAMEADRMAKISAEAQTVKYADIIDNCAEIMVHDKAFGRVFLRECSFLLQKMTKGHKELRQRAIHVIRENQ